MNGILGIALAGLQRATRGAANAANNIANVNTSGYRAQRYDGASDTTSPRYEALPPDAVDFDGQPLSDVDLATEFVDLKLQSIGYRANATVVRVADDLTGELLDVLG